MQRRILIPPQLAGLPPRLPKGEVLAISGNAMGTSWTIKWVGEGKSSRNSVAALVDEAIALVIAEMSTWQPDSWLSRFNSASAGSSHQLPQHAAKVFNCALAVAADSKGAFDPTVGPLVNLWGFGPEQERTIPPTQTSITESKALCGWRRIVLQDNSIQQPGGLYVDFSGIAKGYSVDLIASSLQKNGIGNFLVEVGGELYGYGIKPDGQPWWVALESPVLVDDDAQTIVALHGLAVATSGDYRRYFEHDGVRYSHTIDPRTGYPVSHAPNAVTVLHESCMHADAFATALTVLGVKAGMEYAKCRHLAAAFTVLEAGKPVQYSSPALLAMAEEGEA